MDPETFLRTYGFVALPMMALYLGEPADKAEPRPPVKPEPVVDETRPVRE